MKKSNQALEAGAQPYLIKRMPPESLPILQMRHKHSFLLQEVEVL